MAIALAILTPIHLKWSKLSVFLYCERFTVNAENENIQKQAAMQKEEESNKTQKRRRGQNCFYVRLL